MSLLAGERPATDGRAGGWRSHKHLAMDGGESHPDLFTLTFNRSREF